MVIFSRISLRILKGVIYPCKVGCCAWELFLAVRFAAVRITIFKDGDLLIYIRVRVEENSVLAAAAALCYFLRVDTLARDEDQGNQDHKLHLADESWSEIEADHPLINANFWKVQVQGSAKRWTPGCVNPASGLPLAVVGEFTQLRAHLLADPCIKSESEYSLSTQNEDPQNHFSILLFFPLHFQTLTLRHEK